MAKLCRLCLQECLKHLDIFTHEEPNQDIATIISMYFWFEPSKDDTFSQLICVKCWKRLKDFHCFYQEIRNAHGNLCTMFKEETSEIISNVKEEPSIDLKDYSVPTEEIISDPIEITPKVEPIIQNIANAFQLSSPRKNIDDVKKGKKIDPEKDEEFNEAHENPKKIKRGRQKRQNNQITTNIKPKKQVVEKKTIAQRQDEDKQINEFYTLKCDMCDSNFVNFPDLCVHYRHKHSIKYGYVICCNKKLTRRSLLIEHLKWHLNPNEFRCLLCNKLYCNRYRLLQHMAIHMPEESKGFHCDICGKSYATKDKISHHFKITHKSKENYLNCNECDKAFPTKSVLMGHIRRVHELVDTTVCDICAKIFRSQRSYDIHRREQHEEKNQKVQCEICGDWLKNKSTLYHHKRGAHSDTAQTCQFCGKISPSKASLRSHISYIHKMKPLHKCSFCDKSFKMLLSLKEHQASHTGAILYNCPYCTKTFNSNANMWSHRKNKHPEEWLSDRNTKKGPIKAE